MVNQSFNIPEELRMLDLGFTIFYASCLKDDTAGFSSMPSTISCEEDR